MRSNRQVFLAVECPRCRALPGKKCTRKDGTHWTHVQRMQLAAARQLYGDLLEAVAARELPIIQQVRHGIRRYNTQVTLDNLERLANPADFD